MIDVTEDEIRRSGAEVIAKSANPEAAAEYIQGLVELWKKGQFILRGVMRQARLSGSPTQT